MRYPAWIDGEQGSYGISFPDLTGIVAMGTTVDEALMHAEEPLRDYVIEVERVGEAITPPSAIEQVETPARNTLVSIPLTRLSGRSVRANLTLDEGVAAFIDGEVLPTWSGWHDASPKLADDITTLGDPPPSLKRVPDGRSQAGAKATQVGRATSIDEPVGTGMPSASSTRDALIKA